MFAFSRWHAGNREQAEACWHRMDEAMQMPWIETALMVIAGLGQITVHGIRDAGMP